MDTFEYVLATWERDETTDAFNRRLAALGAQGWEAVGMSPRTMDAPMPGMVATPASRSSCC